MSPGSQGTVHSPQPTPWACTSPHTHTHPYTHPHTWAPWLPGALWSSPSPLQRTGGPEKLGGPQGRSAAPLSSLSCGGRHAGYQPQAAVPVAWERLLTGPGGMAVHGAQRALSCPSPPGSSEEAPGGDTGPWDIQATSTASQAPPKPLPVVPTVDPSSSLLATTQVRLPGADSTGTIC